MNRIEIRRRPIPPHAFKTGTHPVLTRAYAARGVVSDAELDLSLDGLLPVGSLEGVQQAAAILAAHRGGRVLIVGDFDADGATSSALMVRALRALEFSHVDFLVPDRFRFGYGLTPQIVEAALERKPTLIVTVDNGIASLAGAQAAQRHGIEVLVTDHHLPGIELPQVKAIVNPNLAGSQFQSRCLAGVGVAFYVIVALTRYLKSTVFNPAGLLDLVALGTVADVVPLDRNNRILVSQGLRRIRAGRCVPGIRALLQIAGRRLEKIDAADLGFAVAPRLNAAGRLTDMRLGIECLLANSAEEAGALAQQLSQLNVQRREIELRMQTQANVIAAQIIQTRQAQHGMPQSRGVCLYDPNWHQGVVGLVAGRIKDRLRCPVVAFAPADDGSLRGSARSVEGVHIRDALDRIATEHTGLLDKFGGHAMAAGLTLERSALPAFSTAFTAEISKMMAGHSAVGVLQSDGAIEGIDLSLDTAQLIRSAGPWGQGFPEPVFDGEFDILETRIVGERHLKFRLKGHAGEALDGISFGYQGSEFEHAEIRSGARIKMVYRLEVNDYNGLERLQLNAQYLAPIA